MHLTQLLERLLGLVGRGLGALGRGRYILKSPAFEVAGAFEVGGAFVKRKWPRKDGAFEVAGAFDKLPAFEVFGAFVKSPAFGVVGAFEVSFAFVKSPAFEVSGAFGNPFATLPASVPTCRRSLCCWGVRCAISSCTCSSSLQKAKQLLPLLDFDTGAALDAFGASGADKTSNRMMLDEALDVVGGIGQPNASIAFCEGGDGGAN